MDAAQSDQAAHNCARVRESRPPESKYFWGFYRKLKTDEIIPLADPVETPPNIDARPLPRSFNDDKASRMISIASSFADQAFAVGGNFLANVVLARTQTKEEYGMFALSYSLFTFLSGVHNAAILEPYTVYGSGRYRQHFSEYLRLMMRSNTALGLTLSGILLLACLLLHWVSPHVQLRALVGLGLTVGVLLSAILLSAALFTYNDSPCLQPRLPSSSSSRLSADSGSTVEFTYSTVCQYF